MMDWKEICGACPHLRRVSDGKVWKCARYIVAGKMVHAVLAYREGTHCIRDNNREATCKATQTGPCVGS